MNELDTCNYLLENTKYSSNIMVNWGYWLENPYSGYSVYAWHVGSDERYVYSGTVLNTELLGVRPVIEVSKVNVSY